MPQKDVVYYTGYPKDLGPSRVECPKYPGFCITRQRKDYPFIEIFHSPEQGRGLYQLVPKPAYEDAVSKHWGWSIGEDGDFNRINQTTKGANEMWETMIVEYKQMRLMLEEFLDKKLTDVAL
ncbi:hypothetical protein EJ110_NYTH19116 [Nymphaea thermarum]|nr:hypothetical protein EJ110_NYTH19116 [Nymphaea thermarum]